jgi:hypothetical protein
MDRASEQGGIVISPRLILQGASAANSQAMSYP